MKNQLTIKTLLIIMILSYTNNTFSQVNSDGNIPQSVTNGFSAKYPQAKVKRWKKENDGYVAKFIEEKHTYYTTFSQKGNWLKTTSRITWPWSLPTKVRQVLRKNKYASWRIDQMQDLQSSSGHYYKILVNNSPMHIQALVSEVESRLLIFKPDGELLSDDIFTAETLN